MSLRIVESDPSLVGAAFSAVELPATTGGSVDPVRDAVGDFVLFIYPRTGRPDQPEAEDWALVPGAIGCTAESCEFRDLAPEFSLLGLEIYGLSTEDTAYQQETAARHPRALLATLTSTRHDGGVSFA